MAGTFSAHYYHLVFSTKNRAPMIHGDLAERLYEYMGGIIRSEEGSLLKIGGVEDHVHMLVKYGPKGCVSKLMQLVKSKSSKWAKEQDDVHSEFAWQEGFGSFTVSKSEVDKVSGYIAKQQEHHRVKTFKEEFREFLAKHEVDFDEETIWL